MGIDELGWNFDNLSNKEKMEFTLASEKKLALKVTNEVLENHKQFAGLFSIVGLAAGPAGAFEFWQKYWEGSETPEFAEPAWFTLFIQEVKHRANEETKFEKELEAF